jgi:hypothetical protein
MSTNELARAVDRLVDRVGHWPPSRWVAARPAGSRQPADAVYGLTQRLADLEATATGRPPLPVPRLDNDLALPDQVRVMTRDLLAADPPPELLAEAIALVTQTAREI